MTPMKPMQPIYFSIRSVQPFADMSTRPLEGVEGVDLTTADGHIVGMRLNDVRMLGRLEEICEKAGIEVERCWRRVHGDADVIHSRRAEQAHGGGNR